MASLCTVVTDASYCPKTKAAGWACWIVYEGQRHKQYGIFKGAVDGCFEAEIMAIINGLFIAKKIFSPEHFHVVSDCIPAMMVVEGKTRKIKLKKWRKKTLEIIGNQKLTTKHVKAHTSVQDKRSYVNRWCDTYAKAAMKQQKEKPTNSAEG